LFLKLKAQLEKSAGLEEEFAKSEKARVKAQAEVRKRRLQNVLRNIL